MLQSILDDVKAQFDHGNMVTRIILVNTFVLLIVSLVRVFTPPGSDVYTTFIQHIALNAETFKWLTRPWTFITHMFVHEGLWHFAWNMIMLYWFGRIVGDLIGDRKILPLYFIGGIAGALFYILWVQISNVMGIAYGASGAVMCFVVAAAFLAPEYNMRLLLIGDVRLKYVALGLVVIDILFHSASNPGGTFAHFGGALMGGFYVHLLQRGRDLTDPLQRIFDGLPDSNWKPQRKASMKVVHNQRKQQKQSSSGSTTTSIDVQDEVDKILDKINVSGYESLTKEEKDILYQASKKN